jgi:archaellum biogenesis ATPase FlaH
MQQNKKTHTYQEDQVSGIMTSIYNLCKVKIVILTLHNKTLLI